ncbi:Rieske (2Fe-2S) protein [Corynebacterium halotolerans]|uniref:Rieske (2Fe-2S) protein n=1 Tax=Corynebacterium halotolerans TaxID=225326 RepID=UPI003CEA53CC
MTPSSSGPRLPELSCTRRMFLLGTATTFAGAFLAACGAEPSTELAATEVPVGSAVILDGFIIAQPTEGDFIAYSATCPHQLNPITEVEGDMVRCTAHNSEFSIADGAVLAGPSRDPLTPVRLSQEGNQLNVSV